MKKCSKCGMEKELDEFYKRKNNKIYSYCKKCAYDGSRKYVKQNQDKVCNYHKEYRVKNKAILSEKKKEYYINNKEDVTKRNKNYQQTEKYKKRRNNNTKVRYNQDTYYKLKCRLRSRLYDAITDNYKSGSAVSDLGCSIPKLKLWLEMHWQNGMSWDNYGRGGWVIDHIVPLAQFDLSDKNQLLKAVNFSNLQPLWETDNLSKGDKLEWTKD